MNKKRLLTMMGGSWRGFSYDFSTLADGSLPSVFTGSTWAISTGVGVNTPTEGDELLTDGGLENWTNPTNLTSWTESIAGTSTVNQDTDAGDLHGGSSAARLDIDASNNYAVISQVPTLSLGDWFVAKCWMKSSEATGKTGQIKNSNQYPEAGSKALTDTYAEFKFSSLKCVTAGFSVGYCNASAASSSIFVDDCSVKKLTGVYATVNAKKSDVTVKAGWTITGLSLAGIVMNMDNAATPLNYVILHHNASAAIQLLKVVNGTPTQVYANGAIPYVAGATIELRKSGTTYSVYYNGSQIGTGQTISDAGIINNTIHGMFSNDGGNSVNSFFVE